MAADLTVAQMIAVQIGTGAFYMMGTTQKLADATSLLFNIKGCKKFNKIRVILDVNDTYKVEFIKMGRAPAFKVTTETCDDVYAEELREVIEQRTGLVLTLPRVRGINA